MEGLFDNGIDFDEGSQKNIKKREIVNMKKGIISIKAKTVTPLKQNDSKSEQRKGYVYDEAEGSLRREPFFSGNGLRGMLRCALTEDMIRLIKEKEPKFKAKGEDVYLYTSGYGTNASAAIDNVTWKEEDIIRKASPILSLFGAGLSAIEGKAAVSDLRPSRSCEKYIKWVDAEGVDHKMPISFVEQQTFFRTDSIKQGFFDRSLLDKEDVEDWLTELCKKVKESKKNKKDGVSAKETTTNIQQPIENEYIIPGVPMDAVIMPINHYEFTDVEVGAILNALFIKSKMQIGANKRCGWGHLDWTVELDGEMMFVVKCNNDLNGVKDVMVSDSFTNKVETYKEFMRQISSNQISITDILSKG